MRFQLVLAPYDSGHREWRMGRGPGHLLRHGAGSTLRASGHEVSAEFVELDDPMPREIASSFALHREIARRVRLARAAGAMPVVVSGNCGASLGTTAGLDADSPIGVVWLDAHGDFNTPETSHSGFLDGMALATLTGRCWQPLARTIPGFRPVPEANVVLAGVRDLDEEERAALERSAVTVIPALDLRIDGVGGTLRPAVEDLAARVAGVHVQLDLDVLDPAEARANALAPPGGLTAAALRAAVGAIAAAVPVLSLGISAFDPAWDDRGGVFHAVAGVLETLAR